MDISTVKKCYVLDTNVLIHDPNSPLNFSDNLVLIPLTVIEELDKVKASKESVAVDCRQAIRLIDKLLGNATPEMIQHGVPIFRDDTKSNIGFISINMNTPSKDTQLANHSNDNIIINSLLAVKSANKNIEYILVTKDINMRLKSRAVGIKTQDYHSDQLVEDIDALPKGYIKIEGSIWSNIANVESFQTAEGVFQKIPKEGFEGVNINEFILDAAGFIGRVDKIEKEFITVLEFSENKLMNQEAWGLKPNNLQQAMAINLLLDDEIDLVTINGPAGSGKTILALAAAIELTVNKKRFNKIIATRSLQNMDTDIGFLPGNQEDKMSPWMMSIRDACESLHMEDESIKGSIDYVMEKMPIQLESMCYMRGRSFNNALILIEEAQNMTPHQIKSMLTRIGTGSKAIVVGSNNQIDTPYLNPLNSGLTYMTERMKEFKRGGHITLEGVARSPLAEFAEENL